MRTSEWVVLAYFVYLVVSGAVLRAGVRATLRVAGLGALVLALIVVVACAEPFRVAAVMRDWFPGGYLLVGYWATGLLYRGPSRAFEERLCAIDDRLAIRLRPLLTRVPRTLSELFEFAYLMCYPLVPAGLAVLYLTGHRHRADAYWVLVLAATFSAYGVLPWLGTRPPRALGSPHWMSKRPVFMQRVNLAVLHGGSIQVNTFPSGHAASAWSSALFLTTIPGASWLVFIALATCIAVGAVAGRYHYTVDVVAGMALAVTAFAVLG